MAKNKAAKRSKPADVLPELPGKFVAIGMSTKQNAAVADAIRKKLEGK